MYKAVINSVLHTPSASYPNHFQKGGTQYVQHLLYVCSHILTTRKNQCNRMALGFFFRLGFIFCGFCILLVCLFVLINVLFVLYTISPKKKKNQWKILPLKSNISHSSRKSKGRPGMCGFLLKEVDHEHPQGTDTTWARQQPRVCPAMSLRCRGPPPGGSLLPRAAAAPPPRPRPRPQTEAPPAGRRRWENAPAPQKHGTGRHNTAHVSLWLAE